MSEFGPQRWKFVQADMSGGCDDYVDAYMDPREEGEWVRFEEAILREHHLLIAVSKAIDWLTPITPYCACSVEYGLCLAHHQIRELSEAIAFQPPRATDG